MNEKNYYDEIIEEIERINSVDPDQALLLLKKELSMPYIPVNYSKKMEQLLEKYSVNFEAKKISMTREELLEIVKGGEMNGKQSLALTQIAQFNWIGYEVEIQKIFLSKNIAKNAKTIFFEALITQKLDYNFQVGEEIVNPSKSKSVFDSEYCIKNIIEIENKDLEDTIIKRVAIESFLIYLSIIFPENLTIKYVNVVDSMILVARALLGEQDIVKDDKIANEIFKIISKN